MLDKLKTTVLFLLCSVVLLQAVTLVEYGHWLTWGTQQGVTLKIANTLNELGKSIIILTLHDKGGWTGNTIPEVAGNGQSHRHEISYGFEIGGTAYNGIVVPQYGFNKSYVDIAYIKSKGAIQQHADFDLNITTVNPAKDEADLSVTIKPKIAIPDSVVVHVFLYETYVDYNAYNFPGTLVERFMHNVVKQMPTGFDGTLIPALAVGQNHTVNVKLKRNAAYDNVDSMRVAVILQKITTVIEQGDEIVRAKEALAAVNTTGSPFTGTMIIVANSNKFIRKAHKSLEFKNLKDNLYSFKVPFNNSTLELFTVSGRKIKSLQLSDKSAGEAVKFKIPHSKGLYLLKIRDDKNQVINLKILN